MDVLKKPEIGTVGSAAAIVGVAGLAFYAIKRLNELTEEIETINANIEALGTKISTWKLSEHPDSMKAISTLSENSRSLNQGLRMIDARIADIQANIEEDNEQMQDFLDSVKSIMSQIDQSYVVPNVELSTAVDTRRSRRGRGRGTRRDDRRDDRREDRREPYRPDRYEARGEPRYREDRYEPRRDEDRSEGKRVAFEEDDVDPKTQMEAIRERRNKR